MQKTKTKKRSLFWSFLPSLWYEIDPKRNGWSWPTWSIIAQYQFINWSWITFKCILTCPTSLSTLRASSWVWFQWAGPVCEKSNPQHPGFLRAGALCRWTIHRVRRSPIEKTNWDYWVSFTNCTHNFMQTNHNSSITFILKLILNYKKKTTNNKKKNIRTT